MTKSIPSSAAEPVKPNFYQLHGVPKESKEQRTSMQLAARISKEPSFLTSHFKSTAYAIKGVAISFFNAFYYAGRSLVRFTICIIQCEGKKAFQQLGADLLNSGKSFALVAISVFYVGGGLLFPQTVYGFFSPVDLETPAPTPVVPATLPAKPESTKSDNKLVDKLQSLEVRNNELANQLSQLEEAKKKAVAEADRLKALSIGGKIPVQDTDKVQNLENEIQRKQQEIQNLKDERASFLKNSIDASKVDTSQDPSEQKKVVDALRAYVVELEKERAGLQKKLDDATAAEAGKKLEGPVKTLTDEEKAKADGKKLESPVKTLTDEEKAKLISEIDALKQSESQLKQKIASLEEALKKAGASAQGSKPETKEEPKKPGAPSSNPAKNDKSDNRSNNSNAAGGNKPVFKPGENNKQQGKPDANKPGGQLRPLATHLNLQPANPKPTVSDLFDFKSLGLGDPFAGISSIGLGLGGMGSSRFSKPVQKEQEESKEELSDMEALEAFDFVPKAKALAAKGEGNAAQIAQIQARLKAQGGDRARIEALLREKDETSQLMQDLVSNSKSMIEHTAMLEKLQWMTAQNVGDTVQYTSAKKAALLQEIATIFNGQERDKILQFFSTNERNEIYQLATLSNPDAAAKKKLEDLYKRVLCRVVLALSKNEKEKVEQIFSKAFMGTIVQYCAFIDTSRKLSEALEKEETLIKSLRTNLFGNGNIKVKRFNAETQKMAEVEVDISKLEPLKKPIVLMHYADKKITALDGALNKMQDDAKAIKDAAAVAAAKKKEDDAKANADDSVDAAAKKKEDEAKAIAEAAQRKKDALAKMRGQKAVTQNEKDLDERGIFSPYKDLDALLNIQVTELAKIPEKQAEIMELNDELGQAQLAQSLDDLQTIQTAIKERKQQIAKIKEDNGDKSKRQVEINNKRAAFDKAVKTIPAAFAKKAKDAGSDPEGNLSWLQGKCQRPDIDDAYTLITMLLANEKKAKAEESKESKEGKSAESGNSDGVPSAPLFDAPPIN